MNEIEKLAEDLKKDINEKQVQEKINQFFKISQKKEIYEELTKTERNDELQAHPYIILKDLEKAIEDGNKSLYRKYSHIPSKELTALILNDFISKFNLITSNHRKTNKDLYELYTMNDKRQFTLKDKNNQDTTETYFVFNLSNPEQNILTIIKEKRIKEDNIKTEYPDFAIYLNGLPAVCIEIKPLNVGYEESVNDIINKKTYHNFLYCVGTDTLNTFITSNYISRSVFLWESYGNNPKTNNTFFDLATELFLKPEDLIYYIMNNTFVNGDSLVNARVQQYFASKKVINALKQTDPLEAYFKHHTRSGKSITFKFILEYVSKYINKYKKIVILTHDLTVKNNLKGVLLVPGNFGYKELKTKKDFQDAISEKVNGCKIYLTNIQKMESSLDKVLKEAKNSEEYLFLVDENHTHQNLDTGYAAVRKIMFPYASYISATATPILEEKNGIIVDVTAKRMGYQIDNFTPADARRTKIVLPCFFKYVKWESVLEDDKELISKFEDLETQLQSYLNEMKKDISLFATQFKNKKVQQILNSKSLDCPIVEELENIIETHLDDANIENDIFDYYSVDELKYIISSFKEFQINSLKKINSDETKLAIESLKRQLNPKKTELIINHLNELQTTVPFIPKAFLVVGSIQEGMKFLLDLKKQILLDEPENLNDIKQNKYKGIRFGLDVSNTKIGEDNWSYEDNILKEQLLFDETKINGDLVRAQVSVVDEFKIQDKDAVQVLIVVGKHLMGFDLQELVTVFLNKYVHDIKLIMQISTRGATVRDGKDCSYVYDLTPNKDINLSIFKKSFDLYNYIDENTVQSTVAVSEDEALNILKNIEDNLIPSFLNLLQSDTEEELKTERGIIKALSIISTLEDKDTYFNLIKDLNLMLENTIVPSVFINFKEKIRLKTFLFSLRSINKELIERNELFKLSETQKREILHKNLDLLKIDIKDVANTIFGEFLPEEITIDEHTSVNEIEIIKGRKKDFIKNRLMNLKRSVSEKSIVAEIESLLFLLNKETHDIGELESIQERTKEITSSIQETIVNKYNNDPIQFYLYNLIENLLKKEKSENIEEYARIIVSIIVDVINETKSSKSKLEDIIELLKTRLIFDGMGNGLRVILVRAGVLIANKNNSKTFYENLKEELLIFIDDILQHEKEIFHFLENK